jgi:hypothetical protein
VLYPGHGEGKRRRGIGEIPEEGCPTPEENRVTKRTELKFTLMVSCHTNPSIKFLEFS